MIAPCCHLNHLLISFIIFIIIISSQHYHHDQKLCLPQLSSIWSEACVFIHCIRIIFQLVFRQKLVSLYIASQSFSNLSSGPWLFTYFPMAHLKSTRIRFIFVFFIEDCLFLRMIPFQFLLSKSSIFSQKVFTKNILFFSCSVNFHECELNVEKEFEEIHLLKICNIANFGWKCKNNCCNQNTKWLANIFSHHLKLCIWQAQVTTGVYGHPPTSAVLQKG